MNRIVFCAALTLSCLFAAATHAATVTQDRSFVFSFTVVNGTQEQILSFDPFLGAPSNLTGVTLEFESQLVTINNSAGDSAVGVFFNDVLLDIILDVLPQQEFSFTQNLLSLGFTAADFTGGSVDLQLRAFADEGAYTGAWYAGVGIPILDLNPFGGVRLVYKHNDPALVPLPASLGFLVAGLAALGFVRRRQCAPCTT